MGWRALALRLTAVFFLTALAATRFEGDGLQAVRKMRIFWKAALAADVTK
jgi:hypothetical protein